MLVWDVNVDNKQRCVHTESWEHVSLYYVHFISLTPTAVIQLLWCWQILLLYFFLTNNKEWILRLILGTFHWLPFLMMIWIKPSVLMLLLCTTWQCWIPLCLKDNHVCLSFCYQQLSENICAMYFVRLSLINKLPILGSAFEALLPVLLHSVLTTITKGPWDQSSEI